MIVSNVTVSQPAEHLWVYRNGGHVDYNIKGALKIFPMSIYANNYSMANILSPKEVENSSRVTISTNKYHAMLVNFNKDKACCFEEFRNGLYYLDISDPEIVPLTTKDTVTN